MRWSRQGLRSATRIVLRRAGIPVFVAVIATVIVSGARAQQTPAKTGAACWTAQALAAQTDEKNIRKGVKTFDHLLSADPLAAFSEIPQSLRGAVRRVELPAGQKLIALTFDLCEQPGEVAGYDGAVFDYLRANGIKATLFVGGKWFASHEERASQLMSDPLFEIGNHGWAHRNLRGLDAVSLEREITHPQRAYEALRRNLASLQCLRDNPARLSKIPQRIGIFRFPYGACNKTSLAAVGSAGLLAIQWDVSTGDPAPGQSAAKIAAAVKKGVKPGSIILAHANGRGVHTADALPLFIPALKAEGYTFVTVSELLAAGRPVIVQSCYDSRPGDTDRYDKLSATAVTTKAKAPAKAATQAKAPAKIAPPKAPKTAKAKAPPEDPQATETAAPAPEAVPDPTSGTGDPPP